MQLERNRNRMLLFFWIFGLQFNCKVICPYVVHPLLKMARSLAECVLSCCIPSKYLSAKIQGTRVCPLQNLLLPLQK